MRKNKAIIAVLVASLVYAVLRYNIFKGVSFEHLPLYVLNKVFSLAGLGLIAMACLGSERARRRELGYLGLVLVMLHFLISIVILTPEYFGKFFIKSGKMTWQTELSMLAGILGMLFLLWLFVASLKDVIQLPAQRSLVPGLGQAVLFFTALHVFAMGSFGWLSVDAWPGYLPPITLISFLVALGALLRRQAERFSTSAAAVSTSFSEREQQPEQISG